MGVFQDVSNWLSGSYKVRTTKLSDNAQLQHIRLDIGSGTTESPVTALNALPVSSSTTAYVSRIDEASATITYVGEALPGALASDAAWRIKKLDESSGLVMTWADGSAAFDQVWNDRAILVYS